MPRIETIISKEGRKYDLPYPGQVFQKFEQDGRWDYGFVDGVKAQYVERPKPGGAKGETEQVLSGWQASLTTGFREFRGVLTHTALYHNISDWHAAPDEMQMPPVVRALFAAHSDEFVRLGDRVLMLERRNTPGLVTLDAATEERLNIVESKLVEASREFERLHERISSLLRAENPAPAQTPAADTRPRRGAAPA